MDSRTEEIKTIVSDLMNGNYDLSIYCPQETAWVENEFEAGKPCEKLYRNVYQASQRLNDRLREDGKEDDDVETIINCLMAIGQIQSMKMFDYAMLYAEMRKKQNG